MTMFALLKKSYMRVIFYTYIKGYFSLNEPGKKFLIGKLSVSKQSLNALCSKFINKPSNQFNLLIGF